MVHYPTFWAVCRVPHTRTQAAAAWPMEDLVSTSKRNVWNMSVRMCLIQTAYVKRGFIIQQTQHLCSYGLRPTPHIPHKQIGLRWSASGIVCSLNDCISIETGSAVERSHSLRVPRRFNAFHVFTNMQQRHVERREWVCECVTFDRKHFTHTLMSIRQS